MGKWSRSRPYKSTSKGETGRYKYRKWLEENQTSNFCAYCLSYQDFADVEHYHPRAYYETLPKNPDVPANLLLACSNCNQLKGDYHPSHAKRRDGKNLKHAVLNPFTSDLYDFYAFDPIGKIAVNPKAQGKKKARANDNVVLFAFEIRETLRILHASILKTLSKFEDLLTRYSDDDLIGNQNYHDAIKLMIGNQKLFITMDIKLSKKMEAFLLKSKQTLYP